MFVCHMSIRERSFCYLVPDPLEDIEKAVVDFGR